MGKLVNQSLFHTGLLVNIDAIIVNELIVSSGLSDTDCLDVAPSLFALNDFFVLNEFDFKHVVYLSSVVCCMLLLYIYRQFCQAPISLILKVCQSFFRYRINGNMNISNESAIYDDMGHHNVFTITV